MYFVIYHFQQSRDSWVPSIYFPLLPGQCALLEKKVRITKIYLPLGQWNISWRCLESVFKGSCPLVLTLFLLSAAWNVVVITGVLAVLLTQEVTSRIDSSAIYGRLEREMELRSLMIALECLPLGFFYMKDRYLYVSTSPSPSTFSSMQWDTAYPTIYLFFIC